MVVIHKSYTTIDLLINNHFKYSKQYFRRCTHLTIQTTLIGVIISCLTYISGGNCLSIIEYVEHYGCYVLTPWRYWLPHIQMGGGGSMS